MALNGEYIYPALSGTTYTDSIFTNTRPCVRWKAIQSREQNTTDLTIELWFLVGDAGSNYNGHNTRFYLDSHIRLKDSNGNTVKTVSTDGYTDYFNINSEVFAFSATFSNLKHNEYGHIEQYSFSVMYADESLIPGYAQREYLEGTIDITDIERQVYINSAPNFNDEENPVILYTNPSGSLVEKAEICIAKDESGTPLISYRDIPSSGTSYTFNFTNAERQALRNATPTNNTMPIWFIIRSTMLSGYYYSIVPKMLSIVGNMPTITPTVEDGNLDTYALTGDVNTFIKYYSEAVYSIGATASKGSTITFQKITCGNKSNTSPYGSIPNVESGTFLFTVTDSRDNIASLVIEKNFINYVKLTSNLSISAPDTEGTLTFSINGNYYNGSFGAKNNSLTVKYRYKENGGSYSNWTTVPTTITNNTYKSGNIKITGLNYRKTYIVQAVATDLLSEITSNEYRVQTTPVFDWSDNDFNFNVPVDYTENGITYSITDVVKKFDNVDLDNNSLKQLSKLLNVFNQRYELPVAYLGVGANYSSVDVSLYLYGNTIRGYITAKRKTPLTAGNVANELVCQVEFDSGFKVTGFGAVSFSSGSVGSIASFQMDETSIYPNDGSVSEEAVGRGRFDINLCSVQSSGDEWNAYFTFPCIIDINKF